MSAPVPPDLRRQVRRPSERLALVEYIAATHTLQESENLEWKASYDLSTKLGAAKAAKQLIGFANRDPVRAARLTEGYAYLLLGVEAGRVIGCPLWDSANIENWLARFVGPDLVYDVHYVTAHGQMILILEVDPPVQGSQIFALQSTTGSEETTLASGTIYVRRGGKTEIADATEIKMLSARAQQHQDTGLALDVAVGLAELPVLESHALDETVRDSHIVSLRAKLLDGVPARTEISSPTLELRTPAVFREEVERYLGLLKRRWKWFALAQHVEESHPVIALRVVNSTDDNFENVAVEILLRPLDPRLIATGIDALVRQIAPPTPPAGWGSGRLTVEPAVLPADFVTEIHGVDKETTRVRFSPMHVYPQTEHRLQPLAPALLPQSAGTPLDIEWRATASNKRGQVTGRLRLEVPIDAVDEESPAAG